MNMLHLRNLSRSRRAVFYEGDITIGLPESRASVHGVNASPKQAQEEHSAIFSTKETEEHRERLLLRKFYRGYRKNGGRNNHLIESRGRKNKIKKKPLLNNE
ncbi:hypothetical protein [Amphritea sp.]|uniref:hypothetical protein n=1 Tax=Amphritea sp. TaxID=1872502 RepID=UPI003D1481EA